MIAILSSVSQRQPDQTQSGNLGGAPKKEWDGAEPLGEQG